MTKKAQTQDIRLPKNVAKALVEVPNDLDGARKSFKRRPEIAPDVTVGAGRPTGAVARAVAVMLAQGKIDGKPRLQFTYPELIRAIIGVCYAEQEKSWSPDQRASVESQLEHLLVAGLAKSPVMKLPGGVELNFVEGYMSGDGDQRVMERFIPALASKKVLREWIRYRKETYDPSTDEYKAATKLGALVETLRVKVNEPGALAHVG